MNNSIVSQGQQTIPTIYGFDNNYKQFGRIPTNNIPTTYADRSGFTPSSIDNLVIWLDPSVASRISIDTSMPAVTSVSNLVRRIGGSVANTTVSTAPSLIKINGLNALYFNGINSILTDPLGNLRGAILSGAGYSIYAIARPDSAPNVMDIVGGGTNDTFFQFGSASGRLQAIYRRLNTESLWNITSRAGYTIPLGNLCVFNIRYNTPEGLVSCSVNNDAVVAPTRASGSKGFVPNTGGWAFQIGYWNGYWKGVIGEILFYSRYISDAEHSLVVNYLIGKWGIGQRSSTVYFNPIVQYNDADTLAYTNAVEAADGQALEYSIKDAINTFITGCKSDAIWNSIKSSCILMGARTLSGALVPLAGSAPTNLNFVSGDYSRKAGLAPDGSSVKYLNIRANNADPQDDKHISFFSTNAAGQIIGTSTSATAPTWMVASSAGVGTFLRINSTSSSGFGSNTLFTGFGGATRSSSSAISAYVNGSLATGISNTSAAPGSDQITLFRGANGSATAAATGRIAFYSAGSSLDLTLLQSRVNTLYNSILSSTYDADSLAYIAAVEAADGQSLEPAVKLAIDNFITGCKTDGIWTSIRSSCILMGARTLAGALVPLVGTAPTNNNFVSGDYNRKTGLLGDGSTKYLNTNRNNNADGQNSFHMSVYMTALPSTIQVIMGAGANGTTGSSMLVRGNGPLISRNRTGSNSTSFASPAAGFFGTTRGSSAAFDERNGGVTQTTSITSDVPLNANICVFTSLGSMLPATARISFYSIGSNLTLASLDSRLTTLYNTIATAY